MKKIIFILLIAAAGFTACKKELAESGKVVSAVNSNATSSGPVTCTGNMWEQNGIYKGGAAMPFVYNNKSYVFDYVKDKLFNFDGTSWDSASLFLPFNHDPSYGFVIGNKAYVGYRSYYVPQPEDYFWEYDFIAKTWSSKPDYPGIAQSLMATFVINNKAYLAGGEEYSDLGAISNKDTWEYDPTARNPWTKKADLPFISIMGAAGFSIGNKGYIVNGAHRPYVSSSTNKTYLSDLYEYNPSTNAWSFKTAFPGGNQMKTNVFVIGAAAYAGGGTNGTGGGAGLPLYYKYSPATNAWVQIANFPAANSPRYSFSINSRGYVVYQILGSAPTVPLHMYKYTPKTCTPQGTSQ